MNVEIHAPTVHVLLISLTIALGAYLLFLLHLTPIAHWIGLFAYAVLAIGTTAKT